MAEKAPVGSQTLSRGIQILEHLADTPEPVSIDDLAGALGVHRSIAYRLVRTLEEHRLVSRDTAGIVSLGSRLAVLAAGVVRDLQSEALPELTAVANDLGMTCFLAVLDGEDCITLASVEPRYSTASVAQRPGARHSIALGAPGKALLAQMAPREWASIATPALRASVERVVADGYAVSHDEVISSVRSVAVPLHLRGRGPAVIAVVYVATQVDDAVIALRLQESAEVVRQSLGG